jgi:hypothetical protein
MQGGVEEAGIPGEPSVIPGSSARTDKAWLARIWGGFDTKYMKPLLTHSRPTLMETLPPFCAPVARMLTTAEQLQQVAILWL